MSVIHVIQGETKRALCLSCEHHHEIMPNWDADEEIFFCKLRASRKTCEMKSALVTPNSNYCLHQDQMRRTRWQLAAPDPRPGGCGKTMGGQSATPRAFQPPGPAIEPNAAAVSTTLERGKGRIVYRPAPEHVRRTEPTP